MLIPSFERFEDQSTTRQHLDVASCVAVFISQIPELQSDFLADMPREYLCVFLLRARRSIKHVSNFTLLEYLQVFRGLSVMTPETRFTLLFVSQARKFESRSAPTMRKSPSLTCIWMWHAATSAPAGLEAWTSSA